MGQSIIGTTDRYTQLICNTSSELINDWPNITFRIHYNFQVRLTSGGGWYYNGFRLNFHTNAHVVNLACSFGGGGGTTGVLASGYVDLGMGGQSTTHAPGFACGGPFSGNGITYETQSIPNGSLSSNLASYTHNACIINVSLSSPRNYFYVGIYNGATLLKTCGSGAQSITGLSPGVVYSLDIKLINRAGAVLTVQKANFRTNGFSYLDSDVSVNIEDAISFAVKTYEDSFITKIKLTCGNMTLHTRDVQSANKIYDFTFTPTKEQVTMIYGVIPNALSIDGKITLTTIINGVEVGSNEYRIMYKVNQTANAPTITSFDYVDTAQKAIDKTGNVRWVLQHVSKLQVKNVVASSKNKASISTYRVSIGDNVVNSPTFPIVVDAPVVSNSGVYLTIIDSRGLQDTKLLSFTKYIEYVKPLVSNFKVERVNDVEENTLIICDGVFDRLSINGADKNTNIKMRYRFKASEVQSWSVYQEKQLSIVDNKFSYNNIVGQFDVGKSYDFELLIEDYFYGVGAYALLLKSEFEFFVGDGYIEVNGRVIVNGIDVTCPFPIGTVIANSKASFNPNLNWINTKWIRIKGKVIVGVDESDIDFNTANKIGGAKTHTLTQPQLPVVQGTIGIHGSEGGSNLWNAGGAFNASPLTNKYKQPTQTVTAASSLSTIIMSFGGNVSHNNLQPYITKYVWERTE